jgi:hypothetical protein
LSHVARGKQVEDSAASVADGPGRQPVNRRKVEALISTHVEPHPGRPGRAEWRLKERGLPVWAIIGALVQTDNPAESSDVLSDQAVAKSLGEGQAVAQLARDYGISREAVEAAIGYYRQHKHLIDARLIINADR